MLVTIVCRIFSLSSLLTKNTKIKIYRTLTLPLVSYGCETLLFTLREERGLRVFEKRVLRKIFGPKKDEVTEGGRRLHSKGLNDLYWLTKYYSGDQIKKNEMVGACSVYAEEEGSMQGFGGET